MKQIKALTDTTYFGEHSLFVKTSPKILSKSQVKQIHLITFRLAANPLS